MILAILWTLWLIPSHGWMPTIIQDAIPSEMECAEAAVEFVVGTVAPKYPFDLECYPVGVRP